MAIKFENVFLYITQKNNKQNQSTFQDPGSLAIYANWPFID